MATISTIPMQESVGAVREPPAMDELDGTSRKFGCPFFRSLVASNSENHRPLECKSSSVSVWQMFSGGLSLQSFMQRT